MAAKRIRLGLFVNLSPEWIAGAYYLENIVNALQTLPKNNRPIISIVSGSKDGFEFIAKTGYAPLRYRQLVRKRTYVEAAINKVANIFGKEFVHTYPNDNEIDLIFPSTRADELINLSKKAYWIPDFQHHYYPEYFTQEELDGRDEYFSFIAAQPESLLILSSESALKDFRRFYPQAQVKTEILKFAVTHPDFSNVKIDEVKKKLKIGGEYFIIPNQFWKHKNHIVVFEAINSLKHQLSDVKFVFTGSHNDYRNPGYFSELRKYIQGKGIEDKIVFTGFIDRAEQLLLMKNSICIIQPSLFEGWSTVVEDAKALNHKIIASDIPVHREQLSSGGIFFKPTDFAELADLMVKATENEVPRYNGDYNENVKLFGENILNVFQNFTFQKMNSLE